MRLPTPLLRRKRDVHKSTFGHALVLAGSMRMLGAGALCSLAAIRSGAGLVTWAVPKSLNPIAQEKASNVIMTFPLAETKAQTIASHAWRQIKNTYPDYQAIIIGPGMSMDPSTQRFILKVVETSPLPLVIDADALNTLAKHLKALTKIQTPKILTPHPGEMARLTQLKKTFIEDNRKKVALDFAKRYNCVLLLKGHRTVVASSSGQIYVNTTGNPGMATAGSGDVLSGMIGAFLAQGLSGFEAAKWGAYLHGKAGDLAAKAKTRAKMIASDIIDYIP